MASFPSSKVHRPSRIKLGRGQVTGKDFALITMTDAIDIATLTFSLPVIISGLPALTVSGGVTPVSFSQTSPTVCHITCSGALTGLTWNIPANDDHIRTFQGGSNAHASGTFS